MGGRKGDWRTKKKYRQKRRKFAVVQNHKLDKQHLLHFLVLFSCSLLSPPFPFSPPFSPFSPFFPSPPPSCTPLSSLLCTPKVKLREVLRLLQQAVQIVPVLTKSGHEKKYINKKNKKKFVQCIILQYLGHERKESKMSKNIQRREQKKFGGGGTNQREKKAYFLTVSQWLARLQMNAVSVLQSKKKD